MRPRPDPPGSREPSRQPSRAVGPMRSIDYRALLDSSIDLMCLVEVCHGKHRFLYSTPSCLDLLGYTQQEFLLQTNETIFTPESLAIIARDADSLLHGEASSTVIVRGRRKNGDPICLENKVRFLRAIPDGIEVMVCMRDVTQRMQLEEQLEKLAHLDGLTGIANRRSFDEQINVEWKRSLRTAQPLSLLLLDVDYFKGFNDTYGHIVGDDCLCRIAAAVRSAVRRPADFVARYGGEELAVLLPETDLDGASRLGHELCAAVAGLRIDHIANPAAGIVTVSCGASTASAESSAGIQMPKGLLLAADTALYKAKHQGRNQFATALLSTTLAAL